MEVYPVKTYRHLFFDLDHTLWDFSSNSRAVLAELHADFGLTERGIGCNDFIPVYEAVNGALWDQHEDGLIPKEVLRALRFQRSLRHFGVDDAALARRLDKTYMERCPRRAALMPGAQHLLENLKPHYRLHIITNGFTEVQQLKMNAAGIRSFFNVVVTSEMAGAAKPSAKIFRHALRSAGAKASESLMIGDNPRADIAGARKVGMDQVHFAPAQNGDPEATYRIARLDELRALLLQ